MILLDNPQNVHLPSDPINQWVIIIVVALIVFFIFKSGQWKGQSNKNKQDKTE